MTVELARRTEPSVWWLPATELDGLHLWLKKKRVGNPARAPDPPERSLVRLEDHLRRDLRAPRVVRLVRRRDLTEVRRRGVHHRRREVRRVESVHELEPELELRPALERHVLQERRVKGVDRVAANVIEPK